MLEEPRTPFDHPAYSSNGDGGNSGDKQESPEARYSTCVNLTGIKPWWAVTFTYPALINEIVIYNRIDCCGDLLQRFVLAFTDKQHALLFSYTEQGHVPLPVYTIVPDPAIRQEVSTIFISLKDVQSDQEPIALCEVEVYGDIVCPTGKFGLECEHSCNCAVEGEACFVSTGGCPSGCKLGYTGEDCLQACADGQCNVSTAAVCSPSCSSQEQGCRSEDGVCIGGCQPGFQPPYCQEPCAPGFYGVNCSQVCSRNCSAQICDIVSGECTMCVPGKKGAFCDLDCSECTNHCSDECEPGFCNYTDGVCAICNSGWQGDNCDRPCSDDTWGPNCLWSCSSGCSSYKCRPKTGECTFCAPGLDEAYCALECEDGYYGEGCKGTCSSHCFYGNASCSHVDGECMRGCAAGFKPPLCVEGCDSWTFGKNCSQFCSFSCYRRMCDPVTGTCVRCPPGKVGEQCEQDCSEGYYGNQCEQQCSTNCWNNSCHGETGYCLTCPAGKTGDFCDLTPFTSVFATPRSDASTSEEKSLSTGSILAIVEAVVIAVLVITLILLVMKTRKTDQTSDVVRWSRMQLAEN